MDGWIQHIAKVKFGYVQNPESFERVRQLYDNRQQQRLGFIDKLAVPKQSGEEGKASEERQWRTIETGRFNKNYFLEKQLKRKMEH